MGCVGCDVTAFHRPAVPPLWIPACAGMTMGRGNDGGYTASPGRVPVRRSWSTATWPLTMT